MRLNWQMWHRGIDPQTIDKILSIAAASESQKAKIFADNKEDNNIRKSEIKWLSDNHYIRDLLWPFVEQANRNAFGFDICSVGDIQYTEYSADNKGHYNWHHDIDWNDDKAFDRKLSVTVQLSDPSEYKGGEFQFNETENPQRELLKIKGTVLVFPSYLSHKVYEVTEGKRKSLVAWFEGPRWK